MAALVFALRDRHKWEYRNPYNRRCTVCGRHEFMHSRDNTFGSPSWWEIFSDGDPSKHDRKIKDKQP